MYKDPAHLPLLDRIILGLARLYYRKDRADPTLIRQLANRHENPSGLFDDFLEGDTILPFRQGFKNGSTLWDIALINGSSRVYPPPHGEAGDILVQDSLLKLRVRNDPKFGEKSSKWRKGFPAAERYNNAYVVGLGGFMPTPTQAIRIECRMKISRGFHGSTGIWVQQQNTFDPHTGIMDNPFRSFGFSYLGESSDHYLRGLAIETVLGLSVQNKQIIPHVDVTEWHTYGMRWSWNDSKTQRIVFFLDGREVGMFIMHPFGPGEIQLWADNYQIGRGLKIGYLNVPEVDETCYDWVRITPLS